MGTNPDGHIAIDDILLLPGECPPLGSCNFEESMCTWQNSENSDDFDWIRAAGETMTADTGPTVDHTTGTPYGKNIIPFFWRFAINSSILNSFLHIFF